MLVVAAGLIAWTACRLSDSLEAKYRRVRVGMSKQEVEGILGQPLFVENIGDQESDCWWEDGSTIVVWYDSEGNLKRKRKSWETGWDEFRRNVLAVPPITGL